MRLDTDQADFLKNAVKDCLSDAAVYLFGSRVDDQRKGGDIDLLVIGSRALTGQEKRTIKIAFYKRFGERRIDIASFADSDADPFCQLALLEAVAL